MKINSPLQRASLPLLLAASIGTASAAVSVPFAGTTVNFATAPSNADWASFSTGTAAGDLTVLGSGANGMDNPTNGVPATMLWPVAATNWTTNSIAAEPTAMSTNAQIRYVTGTGRMLTGPTGNRYSALIGRFQNNAGGTIESLDLDWALGVPVAPVGTGAVGTDPVAGVHVYFSKTGTAGSWTLVNAPYAAAGAAGVQTITPLSGIALGANFYLAWVDDNGPGSTGTTNVEGNFTIDDIAISNITLASASVSASVSGVTRGPGVLPADPTDDTVSFSLTVAGAGAASSQHQITAPASITDAAPVANGTRVIAGVPIAEFSGAGHTLSGTVADSANLATTADFTVTAPWGTITPTATNFTYSDNLTPADASDDTASYDLSVAGTFTGADYTRDTVPATGPIVEPYGTVTTVSLPATATGPSVITAYSFVDNVDATIAATLGVSPPSIIGTSTVSGSPVNILSLGNTGGSTWTFDAAARSTSMNDGDRNGMGTAAKTVTSATVSLAGVSGVVKFSMDMIATDTSSGFESPGDTFVAELILNDGSADLPPVNLITTFDTNANGVLNGSEIVGANATRTFNMLQFIPDSIQSARVVIRGITDSPAETMVVNNLLFEVAPPAISATAGAVTFFNNNTVTAADDTISAPVTITPVNLGASTSWTSDGTPASGTYAASPTTFTAPANAGPATVTVSNASPAVSAPFTLTRPAITFAASLAAGTIVRNDNGIGDADDTLTFTLNVASTNASPEFAIESVNPVTISGAGAYPVGGTVTVTLGNLPVLAGNVVLAVYDAGYPLSAANVTIAVPAATAPGASIIGQKNFGAGLGDVLVGTPDPLWVNYPGQRQMVMTAGVAADTIAESEVLDLTLVGGVNFTAQLRARDVSTGSNFEVGDKFKAELHVDGGATIIPLIPGAADTGDGSPSTSGTGLNGPANAYINGYQSAAGTDVLTSAVYATAADDYTANLVRDEFNTAGQPGAARVTGLIPLSGFIPAGANDVKLVIFGAGAAGSESFIVENVLFALGGPVDTDADGMDDAYETANGLNPNSAADKFLDRDSDGANNFAEYLAGTGANNPLSKLDFTVTSYDSTTGAFSVTWRSVAGKNYRIFGSPNLQPGTWTDIAGAAIPAAGATTTVGGTLPGGAAGPARQFFEVRVAP